MPALRAVPLGLIAGLVAALLLLTIGTGNGGALILVGMSPLPLFLAGLGAGRLALLVAVVAGTLATSVVQGPVYGFVFAELAAIPALVLVPLALGGRAPPSARRLVLGLTVLGVAAFALGYVSALGHPGGLEGVARAAGSEWLDAVRRQSSMTLPPNAEAWVGSVAFWWVGLAIAMLLLVVAGNALLAQGVLVRFERNLREAPPMASLDLPWPLSVAFAACLAAWLYGPGPLAYIGGNLAEILAVPLALGGFAVVHMAVRRHPARLLMLIGMYVIAFVSLWPLALFVAIGIVEQWLGLRRRMAAGPNRGEK